MTSGRPGPVVLDVPFDVFMESAAEEAPILRARRQTNLGPGRLQTVDIHHSPRWIQTDLD